jgi:YbbR domain-containing protein
MAWHPFRNLGLKAAALVLGALLWFTVSGQQVERKVPGVQVHYRNLPASLQITNQVQAVDVHVRGVESQITALQPGELIVDVDLRGEGEGSRQLPLRTDQVKAPLGVEVTQVDPVALPIVLEKTGTAQIPVRPQIEGIPAPGFVVTEMTAEPALVTAIGPERRLTAFARAITDRVSVAGATTTVSAVVPIGIEDALLRMQKPQTARVTVRVEPAGTRTIAVKVLARDLPPGRTARIEPETVAITLRGASRILESLDPTSILASVDLAGFTPGVYTPSVSVELDGRFAIAAIKPATVTVRVN